jgi:hypothetical protein
MHNCGGQEREREREGGRERNKLRIRKTKNGRSERKGTKGKSIGEKEKIQEENEEV